MQIIKEKFVKDILETKFSGNQNQCAKALGINAPQLNKFLNNKASQAGPKLLGAICAYCLKEQINYWDLIILPKV